jgi:Flp pilus assembly protein TadG
MLARCKLWSGLKRDTYGASAVEFAIVVPIFLLILLGIMVYGAYLGVLHSVQQLTAEAARASIAGLNDQERLTLAQATINSHINSYPMLTPQRLRVETATTDPVTGTFTVTVRYDASHMFVFNLPRIVPAPNPIIIRTAAIQRGGY